MKIKKLLFGDDEESQIRDKTLQEVIDHIDKIRFSYRDNNGMATLEYLKSDLKKMQKWNQRK